jgi:alkylhydroperoxidase family enzyme
VVADWRTAPLSPELAATLRFLEKLTLRPDELEQGDADAARAAGVSDRALRDAATVCALFSMIVRLADSLGWQVPDPERLRGRAPAMLEGGYLLDAIKQR